MKKVLISVGIGIAALAVIFILAGYSLGMFKFFAPKMEEAKREVFHQSKEYQDGTAQELSKMQMEYVKSDNPTVRTVIKNRALRMVAEFDLNDLPDDLRFWIEELKGE